MSRLALFCILGLSLGIATCQAGLLYTSGPFVTSAGTGPGGSDMSMLPAGMLTIGFAANSNYNVAEDFTLTASSTVSQVQVYQYQSNSTTTSTFTALYLQIWDAQPGTAGAGVVWGDLATNRLASSSWTGAYRVTRTVTSTRPIMELSANVATTLAAGTYWLQWYATGSLASGPWAVPVTDGALITGNARHYDTVDSTWVGLVDGGTATAQGLVLNVLGTATSVPEPGTGTLALLGGAALAFARRVFRPNPRG